MKKKKNIHNLDSLEREIYRLRIEAGKTEKQIDHNIEYLRDHFSELIINSFTFQRKNKAGENNGSCKSVLKDTLVSGALNKVTDHITDRAIDGIDTLLNKLFRKKK